VLVVTDTNGCYGVDSVRVVVEIPIPSAITPNGDGVNDRFEIYEIEKFAGNTLQVYNRWGQMVFEAAPYRNEWDGRSMDGNELPEGTYFFSFDFGQGKGPVTGYILVKR
jgi:gliding motility-associated-like protein